MGRSLRAASILALLCSLSAALFLFGCNPYEPQTTEEEAADYYQDKYHERVTVSDSHGLGNYSLFGYAWSGTEYLMSDGTSVVYLDSDGCFSDNRQAAEIDAAVLDYANQVLGDIPGALTALDIEEIGGAPPFETYEGGTTCWGTRYDGDIEAFLKAERPPIRFPYHYSGKDSAEGRFFYSMAYDQAHASGLDQAYLDLSRFFDLQAVTLAVVDPAAFATGNLTLFDEGLLYTIGFQETDGGKTEALRFKPVFVEIADGVTASSATPGVTLKEGDIVFGPHDQLGEGFYRCHIKGEAKEKGDDVHYFIHNDTAAEITRVTGLDQFSSVCAAFQHTSWSSLVDGATYYLGDSSRIKPWVSIESVDERRLVFSYHSFFKDHIKTVRLNVIGSAYKDGSSTSETVRFDSRIVEETEDGWRCVVEIPGNARSDNTLYFQFSYNGDEEVTIQIDEDVLIP